MYLVYWNIYCFCFADFLVS